MMWSSDSDREEAVSPTTATSSCPSSPFDVPPTPPHPRRRRDRARRRALRRAKTSTGVVDEEKEEPAEAEDVWRSLQQQQQRAAWPRRASRPVVVAAGEEQGSSLSRAGSWAAGDGGVVGRARSLTDDDLEELKGCVDLGFGFSYDEIPELCGTLPALELCYSMSQRFMDEHHQGGSKADEAAAPPTTAPASPAQPVAATNWKISSPGDSPDEVKARLKYWAQAVACTVKLCS